MVFMAVMWMEISGRAWCFGGEISGQECKGSKTLLFYNDSEPKLVGRPKTLSFSYVFQAKLVGERPVSVKPWFSGQYVSQISLKLVSWAGR